jgi:multiple sugar transport system substrate-binding protein
MRKFIFLLALLSLLAVMPVAADGHACDIDAPADSTAVNMIGWTYPIIDFYTEELESCNEVENLEVNTQLLDSGAAHEQIQLALGTGGTAPFDIIMVTEGDVNSYVAEEWMLPLNDLIEKYDEEYDISDISGLGDLSVDDMVYGIPMELNTRHLFYRPDLLEQYGLDVPETYDDVIAACGVLSEDDTIDIPFTMNLHAGWAWRIEFSDMVLAFGGQLINDDNTPAFNSEEGVIALEKIVEIVDACMGEEGLTYSIDDSQIGMATGGLAMIQTWATRAAAMDDPDFSDLVGEIEFAPAPRAVEDGPYGATGGTGAGLGIPANSDVDPEVAFLVLMEALDLQSQTGASAFGVASRSAVAAQTDARYLPAVFATINEGVEGSSAPAIGIVNSVLGNWLPQVITGDMSVQELLDAAAEAYTTEATTQGFIES